MHRLAVATLFLTCLSSDFAFAASRSHRICFPRYAATGAVPQTQFCQLDLQGFDADLGSNCGNNQVQVDYCGQPILTNSCKGKNTRAGNPIDVGVGDKLQTETDYVGAAAFPLLLRRYYHSTPLAGIYVTGNNERNTFGAYWRASFDARIIRSGNNLIADRPDGVSKYFTFSGGTWKRYHGIRDVIVELKDASGVNAGWKLTTEDDTTETYTSAGKLVSMKARFGQQMTLTYSTAVTPPDVAPAAGLVIKLTDHFGRSLNLTWDDKKRVRTVQDPDGYVYKYSYDIENRLEYVEYPGEVVTTKRYVYNEPAYNGGVSDAGLLTGIIDEKEIRYATFGFNADGKANLTEHALSSDRYEVTYDATSVTVVDPLDSARIYTMKNVLGTRQLGTQSQPAGSGCAASTKSVDYDTSGNILSEQDFRGIVTTYTHDTVRNLELTKTVTSADGTAQTVVSTEWHPTFRIKQRIAEPNLIVTNTFDTDGNVLTRSLQETMDATGKQGFNATLVGVPRTWTYTYDPTGRVKTVTGPRTDVKDITTRTYLGGNLESITNALGRKTTYSEYYDSGLVKKITASNGVVTEFTYYPRGWLKTTKESVSGTTETHLTSYSYEPTGKIKRVDWPDKSAILYEYDDAQRLVAVSDISGNRVQYTLDGMGNRVVEETKNMDAVLIRKISRVIDALNRVKEHTGGEQ